jgi:NAD(P)-dependent dehydrogenase (short-subunit alcohol dehydrogenase family)
MAVLDTFSLRGKIALVTGGAGLFGRQIVEALAEAGAKTFMASRNLEALEKQALAFRDRGLDVAAVQYDQADEASVDRLLPTIVDLAGGVHILVNNSVARPMATWSDPADAWNQSMTINCSGLFHITRVFADFLADHGGGSIINIGSIQGMVGPDFSLYEGLEWDIPPDYFFHKGGMIQLTRYVASRFGPKGVRCNILSPGGFFNHQDPGFLKRYNERTFLGRMANESDLKGAVVFLASDASAYVTGANIAVDGGYTAK